MKVKKDKIVLLTVFLFFFVIILFLALKLRMGVSPDSSYHLEVSRAYSTTLGVPPNTPDTYQWRDITRIPFLYFWINARLLNLNSEFLNEILLLRLINVLYSLGTVYVTYLLSKLLFKEKWKRILPVFLLTNTLMFVFLSAAINYDNLANLFAVLGIYLFVEFVKSRLNIKYLLWMLLVVGLGCFTKYTILPLAFILVLLSIIELVRKKEYLKDMRIGKEFLLLIPLTIVFLFNISVYGVNLVRYGSLEPACEKILTHEQCLQNGVYYRDNIDIPKIKIEGISHIFELVVTGERMDPISYFRHWIWNITGKLFGVMGDTSLILEDTFKPVYLSFLFLSIVLLILNRKKLNRVDRYFIVISLFYISILYFVQNYRMYLQHNHPFLALQGRYIFPVLPIMYILFSKSIFFLQNKKIKYILILLIVTTFFLLCIPYFFFKIDSTWFSSV